MCGYMLGVDRQRASQQHDGLIEVAGLPGNLAQVQQCGRVPRASFQYLSVQADRLAELSQLLMTPSLLIQQTGSCLRFRASVHSQPHPCFWAQK